MLDFINQIPEEKFTELSMLVLLTGLIVFMGFIVYDLARESKAGKLGTFVLFGVLGLGVLGFVIKEVLVHTLQK